jgi:hypothetical protein
LRTEPVVRIEPKLVGGLGALGAMWLSGVCRVQTRIHRGRVATASRRLRKLPSVHDGSVSPKLGNLPFCEHEEFPWTCARELSCRVATEFAEQPSRVGRA